MGCGASAQPVPATDEQKVEMMQFAVKEMMITIGTHAITNGKDVNVKAPLDQVGKIREFVTSTRTAAAESKEKMAGGDGKAAGAAAAVAEKAGGGMMGGMMGGLAKVAAVADQGLDAAGNAAGGAVEAALNGFADAIDAGIKSLDDAFDKVGDEVTAAKADDIIAVYKAVINDRKIDSPQTLVRGAAPHGKAEADACAKNAVSAYIADKAKDEMVEKMLPVCKEAVQASTACKSWKKVIDSYNQANDKLGTLGEYGQKFKQEPITLDIDKYIVEQIVLGYRDLTATKEDAFRKAPATATVPNKPTTFERCWNVTDAGIVYEEFKKNHYDDFKMAGK